MVFKVQYTIVKDVILIWLRGKIIQKSSSDDIDQSSGTQRKRARSATNNDIVEEVVAEIHTQSQVGERLRLIRINNQMISLFHPKI